MKKLILAFLFSSSVCFGQTIVTTPIANFPNIANPLDYYLLLIANPGVTNYNITMSQLCSYLITKGFPTNNQQKINANAVWISPTNSSFYLGSQQIFGNGTIGQPFYGDYDTIINSLNNNTIANLLAGTFITRGTATAVNTGDPVYPLGIQIVGSGVDSTIIQRSSTYYPQQQIVGTVYSSAGSIRVQDLTIDANSNVSHTNKVECLAAFGNNNYIQNVKFINACNGSTNNGQECFVVYLANNNSSLYSTYGNTIKNCVVSNLSGTYLDGITVSGEYLVEGNRVYMPLVTTSNFTNTFYASVNTAYSSGGKVINNYLYGGTYNIYQDTGASTNMLISGNQLINGELGIFLGPANNLIGLTIVNNHVELLSQTIGALRVGIGFYNVGSSPYQNITIADNYIGWYGNTIPGGGVYNNNFSVGILNAGGGNTNLTGISVIDNQVDPSMYGTFPTNCWIAGNTTTNGTLISVNGFTNTLDGRFIAATPANLQQSITGGLTIYSPTYSAFALNSSPTNYGTAFSQQPDGLYVLNSQEFNWSVNALGSVWPNGGTDLSLDGTQPGHGGPYGDFGGTYLYDYSGLGLQFDGQGNAIFQGNVTNLETNTSSYFVGDGHLITGVIATNLNGAGATAGYVLTYTNSKVQWLPSTGGGGGGSVSGVSASSPLFSSGGTAPNISLTGQVSLTNLIITVVTNQIPTNSGPNVRINAQNWIISTNPPTLGTVTSVTAAAPLASSGGSTPAISISSSTGTGAVVESTNALTQGQILNNPTSTNELLVSPVVTNTLTIQSGAVQYSLTNGVTTSTNTVNGYVHIVDTNMNETITGTLYPTNTLTVSQITALPFTNDWAWIGRMSNYMMEISMSNNVVTFTRLGP